MLGKKRIENEQEGVDTLIGRGCRIEGDVVFQGGLWVGGHIIGNVRAEPQGAGYLIVLPEGRIEGDVCARHIVVRGEVVGNLHATDRVELLARARIIGNIAYAGMTMQVGCSVLGKLMQAEESNIPADHASLSAALRARGYNSKLLIHKAGAFT